MTDLLRELEAQSKFLRKAAAEIAAAGHAGWGNACLQAAEALDTHRAEIAEALADAWRYRAARECAGSVGIYEGSPSLDSGVSLLLGDDADAAIDAHNSAREDGE